MRLSPNQRRWRNRAILQGAIFGGLAGLFGIGFATYFCHLIFEGQYIVGDDREPWQHARTMGLEGAVLCGLIGAAVGGLMAERRQQRPIGLLWLILLSGLSLILGACHGLWIANLFYGEVQAKDCKYLIVSGLCIGLDGSLAAAMFRVWFNRYLEAQKVFDDDE
jgi:hypothetical protein